MFQQNKETGNYFLHVCCDNGGRHGVDGGEITKLFNTSMENEIHFLIVHVGTIFTIFESVSDLLTKLISNRVTSSKKKKVIRHLNVNILDKTQNPVEIGFGR